MWVGGQRHAPAALPPEKKTRYPLYGRLGGLQGRSGGVRKVSLPNGIRSPNRPAVASSYTDWATPAHFLGRAGENLQNPQQGRSPAR